MSESDNSMRPVRVVVTGGGSGLGRVVTDQFIRRGARVHTCDVDEAAVNEVSQSLRREGLADRLKVTRADVGTPADVARLFQEAHAWLGGVDVLVNNVGIAAARGQVEAIGETEWQQALDVNFMGALRCIQAVLPEMKQRRNGVIINVSSSSVFTKPRSRSPYVVTKSALEALSACVAREAGSFGVRCNVVRPGGMDNQRLHAVLERTAKDLGITAQEVLANELAHVSMRTLIPMDEVAAMIVFLASDDARHVTGQVLCVDGGHEWEQ